MKAYALTYWFTWAFLVLAAAVTGVASLQDAFFGGLFAALLSALLLKPYVRLGPRFAPMLGAVAGILWVVLMFFRIRWLGRPDEFEQAQWTLGTDISVHAAGFAGAALLTALRARYEFGRSLAGGAALAIAMTAIPYGIIAWIDHRVAGPVQVVLLTSAEVGPEAGPVRRAGAVQAELTPAEVAFLKERLLVVQGPGGLEAIDDEGRRYWPLWRRRLVYPGNPGGPVRTVLVFLPPGLSASTWEVPLPQEPSGLGLAVLTGQKDVRFAGGPVSQAVRLELALALRSGGDGLAYQGLQAEVIRNSPVGDLYGRVRTLGLSAAFPTEESDARPGASPERPRRPSFQADPAAK
jgi:hypothetical protein